MFNDPYEEICTFFYWFLLDIFLQFMWVKDSLSFSTSSLLRVRASLSLVLFLNVGIATFWCILIMSLIVP